MEKAFDMKVLTAKLKESAFADFESKKQELLASAEVSAEKQVAIVFEWIDASLALTKNPIVNAIGALFMTHVKPVVMGAVDNIDGQPG